MEKRRRGRRGIDKERVGKMSGKTEREVGDRGDKYCESYERENGRRKGGHVYCTCVILIPRTMKCGRGSWE